MELLEIVEAMHRDNIVHLDLKLENVIIDTNKHVVKLIDFGFAQDQGDLKNISERFGSPSYTAPEIFYDQIYDGYLADVFSLGVTLFGLVLDHFPFQKAQYENKLFNAFCGLYDGPLPYAER